ncbi:hypothetical protein [Streptomyces sp. MMG1121]|nr:hypothetical protein [Streptomyces sp. MMG1121]
MADTHWLFGDQLGPHFFPLNRAIALAAGVASGRCLVFGSCCRG